MSAQQAGVGVLALICTGFCAQDWAGGYYVWSLIEGFGAVGWAYCFHVWGE